LSKVATRIWPLWDMDQAGGHVPIIWLMHDLSFPTVFSVRVNDSEKHRSQIEKGDLPPVYEVKLPVAGREVKVSITCKPVSSWGFTSFEYSYKCEVDGLAITENVATGNDPSDRLAAQQLHKRVSVPSFREVPAQRDPVTGLATTKELTVEYKARLELDDGTVAEQWHRYSHFTNMHAAVCSCLEETSPALGALPQPPPKSWGLNGYDAGKTFLEERRAGLDTYMKQIMQSSVKASRNPYILGLFGMLKPLAGADEAQPVAAGAVAAPVVAAPEPAAAPAAVDYSTYYSGGAADMVAQSSAPVPAPAPAAAATTEPAVASTPPAIGGEGPLAEPEPAAVSAPAVVAAGESLDDLPMEDDPDKVDGTWM
jgi:hypothetical protein